MQRYSDRTSLKKFGNQKYLKMDKWKFQRNLKQYNRESFTKMKKTLEPHKLIAHDLAKMDSLNIRKFYQKLQHIDPLRVDRE